MIRSFFDLETERIWHRERSRKLPPDIQQRAVRRLTLLDAATALDDLAALPGNRLHALEDDRGGQHAISINTQWRICFVWKTETHMTSRSPTIIDTEWLDNEHAGQLLVSEFLEPDELSVAHVAGDIGVAPERIAAVIDGVRPIDAELDLRLTRYFRLSEGFFLRLQDRYEIVEAKRALNGELDRIIPRAA